LFSRALHIILIA